MILTKKNPDGRVIPQTYYTTDYLYEIEKGSVGWNINRKNQYGWYEYHSSAETLAEAREGLNYARARGWY